MKVLNTIQKRSKLNKITTLSDRGNGNAYHSYGISVNDDNRIEGVCRIDFQNGPRGEDGSITGVIDSDLLEVVRHRLQCFQEGDYATRENEMALIHIEEALMWMNRRVEDRIERDVLGTYEK